MNLQKGLVRLPERRDQLCDVPGYCQSCANLHDWKFRKLKVEPKRQPTIALMIPSTIAEIPGSVLETGIPVYPSHFKLV
jgi:hypothetical protein